MPAGQANAAKTHCPQGHKYTEDNTVLHKRGHLTKRVCRTCARANARLQRLKKYGLTPETYAALLESQDNLCAICRGEFKSERETNIDHDHGCCDYDGSCGDCVRGVLCGECNRGLARFRDSAELLREASDYLMGRHAPGSAPK